MNTNPASTHEAPESHEPRQVKAHSLSVSPPSASKPLTVALLVEIDSALQWSDGTALKLEWDRDALCGLAREILRALAPTTEDEVLAALQRIEKRLEERG